MERNKMYCGDSRQILKSIPDGVIQTVVSFLPLRDLQGEGHQAEKGEGKEKK